MHPVVKITETRHPDSFRGRPQAQMAESVDALVSNTNVFGRAGSTPALGTEKAHRNVGLFFASTFQNFFLSERGEVSSTHETFNPQEKPHKTMQAETLTFRLHGFSMELLKTLKIDMTWWKEI